MQRWQCLIYNGTVDKRALSSLHGVLLKIKITTVSLNDADQIKKLSGVQPGYFLGGKGLDRGGGSKINVYLSEKLQG